MNEPACYEIRVQGHLSAEAARWFSECQVVNQEDGESLLRGEFRDQAALRGVLNRIFDFGLTLRSVQPGGDRREG